ncbi:MAG: hypothetical protein M8467_09715 [Anaerolineae bacterium]|nr:hypothetical protein [Anaerolineae bacterium]
MSSLESLAFRLAQETDFRTAFAADPQATLAGCGFVLDDAQRSILNHLRSQLALPAESLLQQLLGDDPDDLDTPWRWAMEPCLPAWTEP